MLRGVVERDEDVSGVSGTGKVSTFVVNDDGRTVVFWPVGESRFPTLQDAINTHGHNGKTRFVILDDKDMEEEHCLGCHASLDDPGTCTVHPDFGCPGCLNGVS